MNHSAAVSGEFILDVEGRLHPGALGGGGRDAYRKATSHLLQASCVSPPGCKRFLPSPAVGLTGLWLETGDAQVPSSQACPGLEMISHLGNVPCCQPWLQSPGRGVWLSPALTNATASHQHLAPRGRWARAAWRTAPTPPRGRGMPMPASQAAAPAVPRQPGDQPQDTASPLSFCQGRGARVAARTLLCGHPAPGRAGAAEMQCPQAGVL